MIRAVPTDRERLRRLKRDEPHLFEQWHRLRKADEDLRRARAEYKRAKAEWDNLAR